MSRLPNIKTLVRVKDLIAAMERKRDAEMKEAKVAEAKYKVERAAYVKKVKAHLQSRLKSLSPNFVPPRKRDISEWIAEGVPEEPVCPTTAACIKSKYDHLIAQLNMSAEPNIRLDAENFNLFMAGDGSACRC